MIFVRLLNKIMKVCIALVSEMTNVTLSETRHLFGHSNIARVTLRRSLALGLQELPAACGRPCVQVAGETVGQAEGGSGQPCEHSQAQKPTLAVNTWVPQEGLLWPGALRESGDHPSVEMTASSHLSPVL